MSNEHLNVISCKIIYRLLPNIFLITTNFGVFIGLNEIVKNLFTSLCEQFD